MKDENGETKKSGTALTAKIKFFVTEIVTDENLIQHGLRVLETARKLNVSLVRKTNISADEWAMLSEKNRAIIHQPNA